MAHRRLAQTGVILAIAAMAYVLDLGNPAPETGLPGVGSSAVSEIEQAFESRRSGFMTDLQGVVATSMPDDHDGSRHQRFILRLAGGHTLLVAHNIDLAPRVPLSKGDRVEIRGQYEWNERGGVLHWTHHDPDGSHPGGWIEHEGRRYE